MPFPAPPTVPELMTIAEAAHLTGMPRAYLDERIAAGTLAVHLHQRNGATKQRLTRASLTAAGLLPAESDLRELIALVREQSDRLAELERERTQLAVQLGIAVERTRALEESMDAERGQRPAIIDGRRLAARVTRIASDVIWSPRRPFVLGRGPKVAEEDAAHVDERNR